MMTPYEILCIFISVGALVISIIALVKSISSASASIELMINERITNTKDKVNEVAMQMTPLLSKDKGKRTAEEESQLEMLHKIFDSAVESNLNAYEEACAKYLDRKVDRKRFKKIYKTEMRQLVEDDNLRDRFEPLTSRFKAIMKVYDEWENLER
jgi:CRISPR/Cas system CSM-associated protein Csm2 small subunit